MKEIKIEKRSPEEMAAYFAAQLAKARAEGAEEAWKFMKAIDCSSSSKECEWYMQTPQGCYEMTYAEAKADFEKWKAAQKWEPKVGDVVSKSNGLRGVIAYLSDGDDCVDVWWNNGLGFYERVEVLTPTGEHVDLSQILEALK